MLGTSVGVVRGQVAAEVMHTMRRSQGHPIDRDASHPKQVIEDSGRARRTGKRPLVQGRHPMISRQRGIVADQMHRTAASGRGDFYPNWL